MGHFLRNPGTSRAEMQTGGLVRWVVGSGIRGQMPALRGGLLRSAFMGNTSRVEPLAKGSGDTRTRQEKEGKDSSVC